MSWSHFIFFSLIQTPPNTPPHPTARTRAALPALTPPTAVSWLWMVWNTPWMAESKAKRQLLSTQAPLLFSVPSIPFHSVRTCYKVPRLSVIIFRSKRSLHQGAEWEIKPVQSCVTVWMSEQLHENLSLWSAEVCQFCPLVERLWQYTCRV